MVKPNENEIEVSVFGPGYGECIVIHLGKNEWLIVDSCLNPQTKNIATIEYFANIGVSLDAVKAIVATHCHDDHIRGLSKLLNNCPNAIFALSEAFCKEEFLDLASIFSGKDNLGVTEFSNIWNHLIDNDMPPVRALGTRTIFEDLTKYDDLRYKVESLSPLRINNDDEQEWSVTLHKHAIDL